MKIDGTVVSVIGLLFLFLGLSFAIDGAVISKALVTIEFGIAIAAIGAIVAYVGRIIPTLTPGTG